MINKIIHQIYFNLTDREIDEIEEFKQSSDICKNQKGYEYKLWSEDDCQNLIDEHYSDYKSLYDNFRFEIQKIDFIRFCILHKFGGVYIDLDMFILKPLCDLLKGKKYVFHNVKDVQPNWSLIENDFMASIEGSPLWLDIMKECKTNYYEKLGVNVYETWKGRFIMQTTGPRFLSRYFKNKFPNYKPFNIAKTNKHTVDEERFYIQDLKMNTWIKNKAL